MTNELCIKSLSTLEELQEVQQLETLVWGMDCIPTHQTLTAVKNGGIVFRGIYQRSVGRVSIQLPRF